ncbi:MAG: type 1 glutamine amidotransferase domain-containing protein [Ilumatobacteraceae bacterium]
MSAELRGRTIAFLVANEGVEQIELTKPWQAIEDAGGTPKLVSLEAGTILGRNHLDPADEFEVDATAADADPGQFDALVLSGGVANPDALRMDDDAVTFARSFFDTGKPVAAICHAPWTLVEADVVRGRRMTSWPSVRTDLRNAGADWVDDEVVVCTEGPNELITSRKPDDLPAFCAQLVETFARASAAAI